MRVLAIDDDRMILIVVEKILSKQGFEVISASSGEDGVRLFQENMGSIDLVLLDWAMPGLSGIETLALIRGLAPDLPVLISSGYHIDQEAILKTGAANVGFLEKPYRAAGLIEKIGEMVSE